jgi:hypothetical protein
VTWVLLAPNGEVLASGSWQAVIEAGEEFGAMQRRSSMCDGTEIAPKIRPGYIMAPRGMFPEAEECLRYG